MYPRQPSDDPNQGGQYPGGQYPGGPYPPQHGQYGGHPQSVPGAPGTGPARMPGPVITVRVLMFIGGACGLLLGGLVWLTAAMAVSEGPAGEEMRRALEETGLPLSGAEAGALFAAVGAIPFVYGVISIVLAAFMGRRSPVVLWSVVVFQALAALSLVVSVFSGGFGSIVPLIFAIVMIVLMLLESSRAYYTKAPANPGAY
ncbi:hypothetical protein [Nocardiopsis sp. ATB16-24]|uniref:hypothetical protein n=1 Tax=Nocardiopsis sp. ATB16-24 TaxID=3019555 RepID=UPI00255561F4|nr:hypothetical protein [Nocardiopsis sp. ATB16-24]